MTLETQNTIRWLHLSDFHLRKSGKWSQDVVLRTLLQDISERYAGPDSLDFIFITGDLAFSGQSEEYLLIEQFIRELLKITGVSPDRLMMVPGNHDVDRDMEIDAFSGARAALRDPTEVDKFLGNEGRRRTLFRRQAAFREFANRICGRAIYSETSYHHAIQLNVRGLSVSILLLDSAWLSEGGRGDAFTIVVGERQVIDVSRQVPSAALTIGLMHHPIDWLAPFEHSPIKNLLADQCHLLFRGHVHEDSVETIHRSRKDMNVFTAGASYLSRLSNNCYGYGIIDLLSGDGECTTHKYRNDTKSWDKQESQKWGLIDQTNIDVTIGDSCRLLMPHDPPYPSYLACLIGHKAMEVPVLLKGQPLLVGLTDSTAKASPLSQVVRRMRHVIFWRDCWTEKEWEVEMARLVDSYKGVIGELEKQQTTKDLLILREEHCEKIVQSMTTPEAIAPDLGTAVQQAMHLADSGSSELAVRILERVIAQDDVTDTEIHLAYRVLTKMYLAEAQPDRALEYSKKVLASSQADASDYLLSATCCFNSGEFAEATRLIEKARELGAPYSETKGIATLVVGQTGDSTLLQRLRNNNDRE